MKKITTTLFMICISLLIAGSASAHEFIVKPVQYKVDPGQKLPLSVISAHVFMVSEEMEPVEQVRVLQVEKHGNKEVKLSENPSLMTLDGLILPEEEGTMIIAGHRQGMIWTQTTKGWQQKSRKGLTGVVGSGKYEKFTKSLVTVGKPSDDYARVLGQDLEIVPLANPAEARIGDSLEFKVLYKGAPLSTKVFATYDGFSDSKNTYAYYSEAMDGGIAKVKITQPGVWMVRVQKELNNPTEDYDKHVIRAVLTFRVG